MGDRGRWVRARWRSTQRALWETELAEFGPLPTRTTSRGTAMLRTLWQAEAYAQIMREADRERRRAAVQARHNGATYTQIGEALGISRQAAQKLVDGQTPTIEGSGFLTDCKAG